VNEKNDNKKCLFIRERRRNLIWSIAFILIGVAIGLVIMPSFYYSANQMIDSCNQAYGVENWHVVKEGNRWICSPLHIEYFNTTIPNTDIFKDR